MQPKLGSQITKARAFARNNQVNALLVDGVVGGGWWVASGGGGGIRVVGGGWWVRLRK